MIFITAWTLAHSLTIREDPKHSFYFGFVGACFALAKEHPQLFIEREGEHKGTFVRGVSLEDMMRCSIVARHYVKRRKSGDYGTSNRRSPSVNTQKVDLHTTVMYYQTQEDIAEAAEFETNVALTDDCLCGLTIPLKSPGISKTNIDAVEEISLVGTNFQDAYAKEAEEGPKGP
ncbi:hypothetical protein FHL15_010247 [Xylaria flabelliformis]|uniref:Uncharacterized protein n=1 Tax=Xylaria flabelliformis TaxID=2512241 RepID=A0A553HLR5_9PEZI|nr:hypothetical protein FHL15_010247 [Xylaria flabelliformis]